jgi:hypothetical protein
MKYSPISPSVVHPLRLFRGFLADMFGRFFGRLRKPASFPPLTPLPEDPEEVDWSKKDVLVGTVRSEEQLRYNLSHRCYYTPARFVHKDTAVSLIVLYEEDSEKGVLLQRFGRVTGKREVKRKKIPIPMRPDTDPGELYCYFTLESWQALPHPIYAENSRPGRPQFTNRFLLEHCKRSYQLFSIQGSEDYRLAKAINSCLPDPDFPEQESLASILPLNSQYSVRLDDDFLLLTTQEGEILSKVPKESLCQSSYTVYAELKDLLTRLSATSVSSTKI